MGLVGLDLEVEGLEGGRGGAAGWECLEEEGAVDVELEAAAAGGGGFRDLL